MKIINTLDLSNYLTLAHAVLTTDVHGLPVDLSNYLTLAHAALTTSVHGSGSDNLSLFGEASQVMNKIVWKDASEKALDDNARTVALAMTDLDLTAYTSAAAKFAILQLTLKATVAGTAGESQLRVRKNGTTPTYYPMLSIRNDQPDNTSVRSILIMGLDAGQVIEYQIIVASSSTIYTDIDVLGYIE